MARILTVGIATLDLVFRVAHYPAEDEEMRAESLRLARGGNAANTAVVLARLGHAVGFAGVLAEAPETAWIVDDFQRHGVDLAACVRRPGRPPTSSILVTPSGSRTIVHYRDLPEFDAADFARIELGGFDWIHFEGRNVPALPAMIARARREAPTARISLEAEKPRPGIGDVLNLADVLLTGRALASAWGETDPARFLGGLRARAPHPVIFSGWGADGGYALEPRGALHHAPAFRPPQVVDTVGAGDTFNAGVIHALACGMSAAEALATATRLAGEKCGREGFNPG